MADLRKALWESSSADPGNVFRARQPAMVRAVMHFIETNRHWQVIYAPLRTGTHTANILGLLGLGRRRRPPRTAQDPQRPAPSS
eukprot:6824596-Alexandrium_andersonii.AAC.1